MNGIGEHEVMIESPEHNQSIATMPQKQVEELFLAYRERYIAMSQDPRFEMITIFKNHGLNAGTSLHHPHSQIIATPITPIHIRHRIEEAMRYFDDHGSCVYCDIIEKEKKFGERIVAETENFMVFEPFASQLAVRDGRAPEKPRFDLRLDPAGTLQRTGLRHAHDPGQDSSARSTTRIIILSSFLRPAMNARSNTTTGTS